MSVSDSTSPVNPAAELASIDLDGTLGALYITTSLAAVSFGVTVIQYSIYINSKRSRADSWFLRLFATFLLGAGSGQVLFYVASILSIHLIFFVQLFYCWRIWQFGGLVLPMPLRIVALGAVVSCSKRLRARQITDPSQIQKTQMGLSMASFGSQIFLVYEEFGIGEYVTTVNDKIELGWKLSTCLNIALDIIITLTMTYSLLRSRTRHTSTNNVVRFLVLFTVNTTLITTLLTIAMYITFRYLPDTFVNISLSFLISKSFVNSFFAILNTRGYIMEKLEKEGTVQYSTREISYNSRRGSKSLVYGGRPSIGVESKLDFASPTLEVGRFGLDSVTTNESSGLGIELDTYGMARQPDNTAEPDGMRTPRPT
ncbi:hypothetical protein D9758_005618 [Tetrapyrgos nigripes]|uniref:DUF6534 domain-containing protein n=1 Tax=Tetrapyrgos nigripes TaxID=182062 RepID=A0A8H5GH06_9AGAR|nr:hypothetical protein D9758_005618 [Tetrapyrgos nigripes]